MKTIFSSFIFPPFDYLFWLYCLYFSCIL